MAILNGASCPSARPVATGPPSGRSGYIRKRRFSDNGHCRYGHPRAEGQVRLVEVVSPTAHGNIRNSRLAAEDIGLTVMELEEDALGAAPATRSHEGTPTSVPHQYGALHACRDVARASSHARARSLDVLRRGASWLRGHGQLLAGDVFEQEGQCPVEDRAGISIRDLAAQELLGTAQLLVCCSADGELHAVALRRQRGDGGLGIGRTQPPAERDLWWGGPSGVGSSGRRQTCAGFGLHGETLPLADIDRRT